MGSGFVGFVVSVARTVGAVVAVTASSAGALAQPASKRSKQGDEIPFFSWFFLLFRLGGFSVCRFFSGVDDQKSFSILPYHKWKFCQYFTNQFF